MYSIKKLSGLLPALFVTILSACSSGGGGGGAGAGTPVATDPQSLFGVLENQTNGNEMLVEYSIDSSSWKTILDDQAYNVKEGENYPMLMIQDKLYFTVEDDNTGDTKIWVYDPTEELSTGVNPKLAFEINASGSDQVYDPVKLNDKLYLSAYDGSNYMSFVFDPALPVDINNPTFAFNKPAASPAPIAGKLYFSYDDGSNGRELFVFDPEQPPATTNPMVIDLNPGPSGSYPGYVVELDGKIYLSMISTAGTEPHVYDPSLPVSVSNPSMIADINAGGGGSNPQSFFVSNGILYFTATAAASGNELYAFNPALAISATNPLLIDVESGVGSSDPTQLTALDGKLAFSASTGASGEELYIYDPSVGLSATNPQLYDFVPGNGSSQPTGIAGVGTSLYVTIDGGSEFHFGKFDTTQSFALGINPATISNPQSKFEAMFTFSFKE